MYDHVYLYCNISHHIQKTMALFNHSFIHNLPVFSCAVLCLVHHCCLPCVCLTLVYYVSLTSIFVNPVGRFSIYDRQDSHLFTRSSIYVRCLRRTRRIHRPDKFENEPMWRWNWKQESRNQICELIIGEQTEKTNTTFTESAHSLESAEKEKTRSNQKHLAART